MNTVSEPDYLAHTRLWLEAAVIGLNLCPFAKAVHAKNQIRWVLSDAGDTDSLLACLEAELHRLHATPPDICDTTLIVHPRVLSNFFEFNDFVGAAEDTLAELGYEGVFQIAAFHPQFQFADAPSGDISHYTNRAPYPTLHILRESSVDKAVAAFPDAAAIYEANIRTLNTLGLAGWRKLGL